MIRKIRTDDAEALKEITEEALGHPADVHVLCRQIASLKDDERYFLRVFEDEKTGRVCAFIEAQEYRLLYGEDGWNIIALAVEKENRGRGIGKALVHALETYAKEQGASFVRLGCSVIRKGAHAFYSRIGYTNDKTQKRFIRHL